jgi:hypothetical protein
MPNPEKMPDVDKLTITLEKLCFIIDKARQFDAKDGLTDPGDSSNATDDGMRSVLEDHRNDPVYVELTSAIWVLNEDEQIDLVTLTWLGRGDETLDGWADLRAEAARDHNSRTSDYVLGIPLLSDYLEEALSKFGLSCDDLDEGDRE